MEGEAASFSFSFFGPSLAAVLESRSANKSKSVS